MGEINMIIIIGITIIIHPIIRSVFFNRVLANFMVQNRVCKIPAYCLEKYYIIIE